MPAGRKPKYDLSGVKCPNRNCPDFAKEDGAANVVSNGRYKKKSSAGRRFKCKACGFSFTEQTGILFEGFRSGEEKVIAAFKILLKGVSVRKTARLVGVTSDTVRRWISVMAERKERLNSRLLDEVGVSEHEIEEFWKHVKSNELRARAFDWRRRCGWRNGWD